jgi:PAS domain S-box-containing protein
MMPFSCNDGSPDGSRQVCWESGEHVFRRGWRLGDSGDRSAVLFVSPVAEHPSPASLDRLAHEYDLKHELDAAWAVRPLDLVREGGRTVLVLSDTGGESLERLLGPPMAVSSFLRLAIGIAAAIGKLHARSLVHKDIKPANILVNGATGEVWLTGFGIASRLVRERQSPDRPDAIAGTLAYMAPEQTGRMNRSTDSRSDLYALGVTFYQMLTGALPFTATEPMEWVHCHLAKRPIEPSELRKQIPGPVSALVMKLLAKTAEDRYHTAAGLESDLRNCQSKWETQGRIDNFPLGEHDTPDRLLIPERLYGRQREVETLLAAFGRIVSGATPELVLVSGYSGIGKSSLVNELQPVLVPPRGLFASGKFNQHKRDIPYSTLAQAFQSLIRPLLGKSEADLARWRDALRETLGANAGLIVDLVSEVKLIIGEPPPVPEVPPQDAQRRFQLVLRQFIGVFARPEHPLALFLDDLQWLDAATLDLLEDLLTRSDLHHLMLIGAYRANEVTAAHPLMQKIDAIKTAGGKVKEIKLGPLAREHLEQLIVDALGCESERGAPLAALVHEKTDGNPFFATQFISSLADERMLIFDHDAARWFWDLDRIHAKGYTDNVVDLMVGKLNRLPVETQKTLQNLACFGNVAEIAVLSIALESSDEQVNASLWEATRLELVERLEDSYKFIHDRVQEAAYSLIPEELRAPAHLRIGRLLVAHIAPEKREKAAFEIVNQLNRGAAEIASQHERDQLAEFNLIAGRRAKGSTAYASALKYLIIGAALFDDDCWARRRDLIFVLELERAECEFLTGELAAADERLTVLSNRTVNTIERARVACLHIDVCMALDQSCRAVAVALDYLRHVDIDWSPHPTEDEALREYQQIWSQLGSRTIENLIDLPLMTDPESLATVDVLTKLSAPALVTDRNLSSVTACRAVNLSLAHGNCDASCLAYVRLGSIAGPRFGDQQVGFRFGQVGYELVERHGLKRFQAHTYFGFALWMARWMKHVRRSSDLMRRALDAANKIGDLTYAAYASSNLNSDLLFAGDPLSEVQREVELGLALVQRIRFGLVTDITTAQLALIRTLRGLTPKFGCFASGQIEELSFERHLAGNPALKLAECWYWVRKLQARYVAGDYKEAMDASSTAQRLLGASFPCFEEVEYHFYSALSHSASCDSVSSDERQQHLETLALHQRELEMWAKNCPNNFENRAALVGAEIARIEGRDRDAMNLYEKAIHSARTNGFVHNEALAYERASAFYGAQGFYQFAELYLRNARSCYASWGADGKVRQLDRSHPYLKRDQPMPGPTSTITALVEGLDLATVIQVLQAVSGEIVLERLLDTVMRKAVEHAGAERGLLIVTRGDELQIEAESMISGNHVTVRLGGASPATAALPESIVRYVMRTHESAILDDASSPNQFSDDPYLLQYRVHSILCLPLINQAKLNGILYLENNLTARVFTAERVTLLKMLASQAAISLENTRLYRDLADREGKIRRLFDANIIGIFVSDFEGRILEANDTFLRIVGYDREDLASGRVRRTELSPPEWHERDERALVEMRSTGRIQPLEKEYFRRDGSRVPVLVGAALFKEGANEGIAFVLDLTERKRAEERLRVQHTVAQILAEAVTIEEATPRILRAIGECLGWDVGALWRVDLKAEALRCVELWHKGSMEVSEFERVSRESIFVPGLGLPGRVWSSREPEYVPDVVSDENFPRGPIAALEELHAALAFPILLGEEALGVIEFFSREIKQPDQELLNVLATIGSQIGQFIERKHAEEALQASEAKFRAAIDGIAGLVAVMAPSGELETVNRPLIEYFGRSVEELKTWGTGDSVHPEDLPRILKSYRTSLAAGTPFHHELRLRRFDGEYRWFENRGAPIRDESGRITRWYCLLVDIDERTCALARLQQMQLDLAHMNRVGVIGELAASLSHEITQPIASARNNACAALNFLDKQLPDVDEVREALGCIVGDADRAKDIIDRIRDHLKKAPPRKDHFDLGVAINEVTVLARDPISRNGVSVQSRLADGLFPVQGDRVQLQQVLLNLILNAVEAMGSVETGPRELLISAEQDHAGVRVAVRDSGPGIDQAHLERVFDAFYTTKPSGVGMGLSICRSIIDAHGGRLWAEANEPCGAIFQFTLPSGSAKAN